MNISGTEENPPGARMAMFGKRERTAVTMNRDKVETIIGIGVTVKGNLISSSPLRIDGVVEGNIECQSDVYIGQDAKVVAEIKAANISIAGEVRGNLQITGRVEIAPSGKVFGDVKASVLAISEGAVFCGLSQMGDSHLTSKQPNLPHEQALPSY